MSPSSASINNFKENIAERYNFCRDLGIDYLHVVFPTKDLVAPEMLPDEYSSLQESLFDRCYRSAFGETLPDYLLYPLNELRSLHRNDHAFLRTDTHLSASGRLISVNLILSRLGLYPSASSYFYRRSIKHSGDLAAMLDLHDKHDETWLSGVMPSWKLYNNIKSLRGNSNNILIASNDLSVTNKRVLIFGDSFIAGCVEMLSAFFKDIIYLRSSTLQRDAIALFAPDVVISSNAERYLSSVGSDHASGSVIFSNYGSADYSPDPQFSAALRAQISCRHHRKIYESWRQENLQQPIFVSNALGPASGRFLTPSEANKVRGQRSFISNGNDPQLLFPRAGTALLGARQLIVEIHSGVKSKLEVFTGNLAHDGFPFSHERAHSKVVEVGYNKLIIDLDPCCFSPMLRVDPVSMEGEFTLISTSIDR